MLIREKTPEAASEKEVSVENNVNKKITSLEDMKGFIVRAEFYATVVFGVCAALCLYLFDKGAEAIAALVILAVAVAAVLIAEKQHRDLMGLDRSGAGKLMFSVYNGRFRENGLRFALAMRLAPLCLGAVALVACLIRAIWGGVGDYGLLLSVMALLSASAIIGVELPVVIAVSGGIVALKQHDIEVRDPEKLGVAARVKYVLGDKSVFFASKGTETGGVYINGKAYGVSELSFDEAYPLLSSIYVCDDGALSAAFGFRQQITDGLLRALRTTRYEHSAFLSFHVTEHYPYDPAAGYTAATYINSAGAEKTCFVGRPDALFPHLGFEYDQIGLRPLGDADMRHLRLHLRRTYSAGREVMVVAEQTPDGKSLVLIGLLHMNCIISQEARESVRELKSIGVEPIYVSEENESCAFYHARELGVARDMSQVLTGSRIDRFKHENLVRAMRHARLCAEADGEHRNILTEMLSRERVIMSSSRSGSDELLRGADVRVSSQGGKYSTDFQCRNCSIEDVSFVARVARSVCSVARRAEYQMFCASVCACLVSIVSVIVCGRVPFGVAASLLIAAVLPLPQMLLTAKMDVAPPKGLVMSFMMENKSANDTPVKTGAGLAGWNILNCIVTAIFASYVYCSYASSESVGAGGASAAVFLTVGAYMLANNLVCRVWGKSCLSLKDENGGVAFLICTLLVLAAVLVIVSVGGLSSVFGMEALGYKRLPVAFIPAAVSLLTYEIGGAVIRHRKSHGDK